jgi:hypothetical protein
LHGGLPRASDLEISDECTRFRRPLPKPNLDLVNSSLFNLLRRQITASRIAASEVFRCE